MYRSLFLLAALPTYLVGCASTSASWGKETSINFYKPDLKACQSGNKNGAARCTASLPFTEKDLRRDFDGCKRKHHLRGMVFDDFDPGNKELVACMGSLGWDLQSAIGDSDGDQ